MITDKLWIYIFCPIWSFLINLFYWIPRIRKLKTILQKKKMHENMAKIHGLSYVKETIKEFSWTKDNFKDWTPWVITIINENLEDDCDGAAKLGKWLLKHADIESKILHLRGEKSGHAVCLSKDKTILISNSYIKKRQAKFLDQDIFDLFKGKYNRII